MHSNPKTLTTHITDSKETSLPTLTATHLRSLPSITRGTGRIANITLPRLLRGTPSRVRRLIRIPTHTPTTLLNSSSLSATSIILKKLTPSMTALLRHTRHINSTNIHRTHNTHSLTKQRKPINVGRRTRSRQRTPRPLTSLQNKPLPARISTRLRGLTNPRTVLNQRSTL